jgi:hypothetical protein
MSDSEKDVVSTGNGVQDERHLSVDPEKSETLSGPVKSPPASTSAPTAAAVDPATAKAVENVLYSDVRAISHHGASLISPRLERRPCLPD